MAIVGDYVTERGRTRQRTVTVELDAIRAQLTKPSTADGSDWRQIRASLERVTGEQTFAIWLARLELLATDPANTLLLTCPPLTRAWLAKRFGRVLEQAGRAVGRELRLATERELQLIDALRAAPGSGLTEPLLTDRRSDDQKEAL